MRRTRSELVHEIALAIGKMEGFGTPGTVATRNNNPGNLRKWGNVQIIDGFASFPSAAAGWEALRSQVSRNVKRGLTLREFFQGKPGVYPGYAPSSDGNRPSNYAEFVAGSVGIPVDKPIYECCAPIESAAQREMGT